MAICTVYQIISEFSAIIGLPSADSSIHDDRSANPRATYDRYDITLSSGGSLPHLPQCRTVGIILNGDRESV